MQSVEEAGLRWTTTLWKQSRPDGGRFALQMRQNPLDYRWVFNAGDDLDLPRTALADLNIDPDAAQLNPRFGRCIQVIDAWRSDPALKDDFGRCGKCNDIASTTMKTRGQFEDSSYQTNENIAVCRK
jgi:hypothetical protein